jgi:hypothetical protein
MPLPESRVVAEHGGETVFVPYLAGHSTTGLIERARTTSPRAVPTTTLPTPTQHTPTQHTPTLEELR